VGFVYGEGKGLYKSLLTLRKKTSSVLDGDDSVMH
jgi:hypothetical protein